MPDAYNSEKGAFMRVSSQFSCSDCIILVCIYRAIRGFQAGDASLTSTAEASSHLL
jgi:hypothetical protein